MSRNIQALQSLLTLLNTSVGRDKTARLVQYFNKFLITVIQKFLIADPKQKTAFTALVLQLTRVQKSMGMFRKLLRFGKFPGQLFPILDKVGKLQKALNQNKGDQKEVCNTTDTCKYWLTFKILNEFSFMIYCITDHFLWAWNIGVIKKNPGAQKKMDRWNNILWLGDAVNCAIADIIEFVLLQQQIQQQKGNKQIELQINQKMEKTIIDLVRNVADIPVILHFLEPTKIPSGLAGFLGAITSVIGIHQNWK